MKEVKTFQQMYRDGRMSRREFLGAIGALGLSATTAGSLLTASSALAATPVRGGSVIAASNLHGPDDTLDPIVCTSTIDYSRQCTIHNGLIQIWDNMSLHPELAEEWSVNSNATEYVFKIRKGVEFHSGGTLSADDVIWSMNRHLGEDSPSSIAAFFSNVVEWKKIDSHTVKLSLSSPDADMPIKLTQFQAKIVKEGTTDFSKGAGTGPYVVDSFQPGIRSVHSRNPNYWRSTGQHLDQIEITAITDPNARLNALLSGDVDMATVLSAKSIKQVESTDGVEVMSVPAGLYGGICCLKNTHPGGKRRFCDGIEVDSRSREDRALFPKGSWSSRQRSPDFSCLWR